MALTEGQRAELRAQVRANPACAQAYADRDCHALADLLSMGRVCGNSREIGNGTVLQVLGLVAGSRFLEHVTGDPAFRFVVPLLDQGRLLIGSQAVRDAIQQLAQDDAIAQADADALCALGLDPDPLTMQDVGAALYQPDGTPIE